MSSDTISIISLCFSFVSAIISFLSFTSNRAELIFFDDSNSRPAPIASGEISAIVSTEKNKEKNINFPNGILYHIQVFNPSPQDVAFFNMSFNIDGNRPISVWNKKTFGWSRTDPKIVLHDLIHGTAEINIPDATQGVFRAHSFTPLYLFMTTDEIPFPNSITFNFQYAVRKFPYIGKSNRYKTFKRDLDINGVELEIKSQQETMKLLTQQAKTQTKPKQTPPYNSRNKHKKRR